MPRRTIGGIAAKTVARALEPLFRALLGPTLPVRIEFWDGSALGPSGGLGPVRFHSADAIRRLLWSPDELGFGRAFVAGELDIEGDLFALLRVIESGGMGELRLGPTGLAAALAGAARIGALHLPLPPPPEEAKPRGGLHSRRRDATVVRHHYDVGNRFYELVLGPSLTYSCAYFREDATTLEDAQAAKHELVCAKLGLTERRGMRLLDVGCGWGSMAMHAAAHHDAMVVGVTISEAQADSSRRRIREAGLADRIDVRVQDYRDLGGETFDAICSIGMFEHVGNKNAARYFETLRALLKPTGRLVNHAISAPGGHALGRRSFAQRYVFPDGELSDVGDVVLAMERAGFEVRDVESLREHYSRTLRAWVANLEAHWAEAVAEVGVRRARVWRLYMAGSAVNFDIGELSVHQVLGVVPDEAGGSAMPGTRAGWMSAHVPNPYTSVAP